MLLASAGGGVGGSAGSAGSAGSGSLVGAGCVLLLLCAGGDVYPGCFF